MADELETSDTQADDDEPVVESKLAGVVRDPDAPSVPVDDDEADDDDEGDDEDDVDEGGEGS